MEHNDIVYGVHAVVESLEANTGNKLYIQDDLRGKNVEKIKALAAEKKVSISWTPKKTLSDMTEGAVHQGFVLRVSEFAYADLSVILEKAEQEDNPLILILDGLTDPHNFGSILRTADATRGGWHHHSQAPSSWRDARCGKDFHRCGGPCPNCPSDQS